MLKMSIYKHTYTQCKKGGGFPLPSSSHYIYYSCNLCFPPLLQKKFSPLNIDTLKDANVIKVLPFYFFPLRHFFSFSR